LTTIKEISSNFPALPDGAAGLISGLLGAFGGEMESRKPYNETETWRLSIEEILGSQIGLNDDQRRVIFLHTTSAQDWQIQNFFEETLDEIQAGISMAKAGKLSRFLSNLG
jgi:hypothetical protein